MSILDHLDADAPTMLTDLAIHMGVTPATMSIAIGRLVEQGYVTRVLDPVDRRKVQLRLTDAGVRICAANSVLEPTLVEEMLDQLSDRGSAGRAARARSCSRAAPQRAATARAGQADHQDRRRSSA